MLAAAGLHALDNHVDRLADDHVNAARLAAGLGGIDGIAAETPDTNMVWIEIEGDPSLFDKTMTDAGVNVRARSQYITPRHPSRRQRRRCRDRRRSGEGMEPRGQGDSVKVANAIAEILRREGVEFIVAYPVNPIIEAAAEIDIRTIIVRQERVGLHMADRVQPTQLR